MFSTVAISVERYLAVAHPFAKFRWQDLVLQCFLNCHFYHHHLIWHLQLPAVIQGNDSRLSGSYNSTWSSHLKWYSAETPAVFLTAVQQNTAIKMLFHHKLYIIKHLMFNDSVILTYFVLRFSIMMLQYDVGRAPFDNTSNTKLPRAYTCSMLRAIHVGI